MTEYKQKVEMTDIEIHAAIDFHQKQVESLGDAVVAHKQRIAELNKLLNPSTVGLTGAGCR